jgi:hypothetical protein
VLMSRHVQGIEEQLTVELGLRSLAVGCSIPCSGSFTEACRVYSEGRTWLGEALLAGLRWRGIGWPRARRARGNAGDLVLR